MKMLMPFSALLICVASGCVTSPDDHSASPTGFEVRIQPAPVTDEGYYGKDDLIVSIKIIYPDRIHRLPSFDAQLGRWMSAQAIVLTDYKWHRNHPPTYHWHRDFRIRSEGPIWDCAEGAQVILRCVSDGPDSYRLDAGIRFTQESLEERFTERQIEGVQITRGDWHRIIPEDPNPAGVWRSWMFQGAIRFIPDP